MIRQGVPDVRRKPQSTTQKRSRRNRARRWADQSIDSRRVRDAYVALLGSARALELARRFDDARSVLLTALSMALRLQFTLATGKEHAVDLDSSTYAHKLRTIGALDRETFQAIGRLTSHGGPYGEVYVSRLADLTRHVYQLGITRPDEPAPDIYLHRNKLSRRRQFSVKEAFPNRKIT